MEEKQQKKLARRLDKKISANVQKLGSKLVYQLLKMYYAAIDKDTPVWAKSIIFSALVYFVLPLDMIPDFIPVTGFTDDISALGLALVQVGSQISDEHKSLAKKRTEAWFGSSEVLEIEE
ncbi:YkvA family protein [Sediminitomix flava]|uniref:Uncharacterized protein DUF1232 n=1 Tax=Sediminitomix flava TaxID=379075 RepID=A0A315ZBU3_SEDFL|nr:YkvA family protein [Sediminitomix flava]PWJ43046.1 uncharacterized protein DUF1232 [Sediminitomix flava]